MANTGMKEPVGPEEPTRPKTRSDGLLVGLALFGLLLVGAALSSRSAKPPHAPMASAALPSMAPAGIAQPVNTLIEWDEEERPGATTYAMGGLSLTLQGRDLPAGRAPVLTVVGPDGKSIEVVGSSSGGHATAEVGVGRIDEASTMNQVVFTSFTGGAHCCVAVQLVEVLNGTWQVTSIATQDGGKLGAFPKDFDGDGHLEFKLTDDRFLYAFASYAESRAPPLIVSVNAGQTKLVSAEPRFRPVYEAFLTDVEAECRNHGNGACPAYVAAAARTGKIDQAWPIMLGAFDPTSDWILPVACQIDDTTASCPQDRQVAFDTYPEALRWFLGDAGYGPKVYIPSDDTSNPSFPCGKVKAEVLRLICATPELRKADRQLAVAFGRAMALAQDPATVRSEEARFLEVRDSAPPDVFTLLRIYQARIAQLGDA